MKYDVTVYTSTTFTVEAKDQTAAANRAVEAAELKPGLYYDWQVERVEEE